MHYTNTSLKIEICSQKHRHTLTHDLSQPITLTSAAAVIPEVQLSSALRICPTAAQVFIYNKYMYKRENFI